MFYYLLSAVKKLEKNNVKCQGEFKTENGPSET